MSDLLIQHSVRRSQSLVEHFQEELGKVREYYGRSTRCHANSEGDCNSPDCPQIRDGEPEKTHRHCPLDFAPGEPTRVARWESPRGAHWVELRSDNSYSFSNGGGWYSKDDPYVMEKLQDRINRGEFLPDKAKQPMRRVV